MNWEAIGALGEIFGALAVFVTLAYLAMQIRQNTKAVRAAALDSSVNLASVVRSKMVEDSELTEIFLKGSRNPESLSGAESVRYQLLMTNILWAIWNPYSQIKYAELSSSVWKSQRPVIIRILNNPGGKWFWKNFGNEYEEYYCLEIENILASVSDNDS